jgi:tetratricopeptide (TPR) repeat protein
VTVLLAAALLAVTPATLSEQAQTAAQAGRADEAERLWKQAIALDANFFPAVFNLGFLYFNRNQWQPAAGMLEKAAVLSPKDFNTRYLLGGVYSRLERTDDALRQMRAALQLKPDHLKLLQLAAVEYSKGRYFQEAVAACRRALDLDPDDPNNYFLTIKVAQDAGDADYAAEIAARAAGRFPDSARAHTEHGFHLAKHGQVQEAVSHLEKAMQLDPNYEEPYFFFADLLVKNGDNNRAIEPLRQAIRIRPDYIPARVLLARALMNLDRFPEAMTELNATIERDPKHPQPHLLLSQIYFRMGDEDRAKAEKDLSLKLRRENPAILEAIQGRKFPAR